MALKDLIASKASLSEGVIEEIVSGYVRYDADNKSVFLTPESQSLSNKAKILVYLVALQGWPFVLDEAVPVDAKPSEIEEHTGIRGGSLRPTLRELKDRRILVEKGSRYSVRSVSLHDIKAELGAGTSNDSSVLKSERKAKPKNKADPAVSEQRAEGPQKKTARRSSPSVNKQERLVSWLDKGFFDQPRSLSDIQKRFHKEAVIVPMTSLPQYLLGAVRSGRLEREKLDQNGKSIWVYRKAN
jgi:hypothetical protein